MSVWATAILLLLTLCLAAAQTPETVGQRPYEMVWAGRDQDDHPPLVDFEDLTGWTLETEQAQATLTRTREQQLWGKYVARLTYRGTGSQPVIRLLPPEPIRISAPFDAVTLWCYGNNWGWAPDPSTPQVAVSALFEDAAGREFSVYLQHVDWTEWFLLHRRLTPEQIQRVRDGARFRGIQITGGRNRQDRTLYFDNLAVFVEKFPPLTFAPRPQRGIAMFPGQTVGTNTGPGKLPFPTRAQTILPPNLTADFRTRLNALPSGFQFVYEGADGTLTYLLPRNGSLSEVTAAWTARGKQRGVTLRPCAQGGVYLAGPNGPIPPQERALLSVERRGQTVVSRWRLAAGSLSVEATYTFRLWNKSLVVDIAAPGGQVAEVRFGYARQGKNPRLVTHPFYPLAGGRPATVVFGEANAPLFLMGNADWYLSNASILYAANGISEEGVQYNGGARYLPKTDGRRNDCYERLFITLSPRIEETLPVVANPVSPWKRITGTRVWRAHGASDREADARFWTECRRWGMTQVVVTDHETMWRDGGESFTFRTRTAPGKGGEEGQRAYSRLMQQKLGFIYGPYNNFTDFAPVNEYWHIDLISRTPDNQLQRAWMRCYAPKPARAVEFCEKLSPINQAKYQFSTAYCDVHTAVPPWDRVDYDARVPGAGTFAAVFYAYGEIMLLQKKAWKGPVYSEGNYHAFYCGLTDGNYGQDQSYRPAENPWLADFDLLRLHHLGCNFGMGSPDMFYASVPQPQGTLAERDAWIDRFLAATVAFGHPGFLVFEGGYQNALRSYYMLQQLHSRYCLSNPVEIRYADGRGRLLETSAAVAGGDYRRSQIVTRYADGTVTVVNGSKTERMSVKVYGRALNLPPNGYAGWTQDGQIEVLSSDPDGHRCDYAVTPAYLYVDGRGRFVRFPKAAGNGIGICRILPGGDYEILLYGGAECGFAVRADSAVALDKEGRVMGPAALRVSRGLTYVVPVKGAFSYRLKGRPGRPLSRLRSERWEAAAGERITVTGRQRHVMTIPAQAQVGERIWRQAEGEWIDFTVAPLADIALSLEGSRLLADLSSRLPAERPLTVRVGTQEAQIRVSAKKTRLSFELGAPREEDAELLTVEARSGAMAQKQEVGLRVERGREPIAALPGRFVSGMRLRGQSETLSVGLTGAVAQEQRIECGGETRPGIFMHPPWQGGVGYVFVLYEPVRLPADLPARFRASVGKADGSDPGDGILFQVAILDEAGQEHLLSEHTVTRHGWEEIEADLSRWAGQRVRLKLIADVGRADNSTGDWAGWSDLRLEARDETLRYALDGNPEAYRRAPGPMPVAGLTVEELRRARAGWLRYEGKGLEGEGLYATYGLLNGIEIGTLAPAHGSEQTGEFSAPARVPLPPEAIRALKRYNRFTLLNPNRDSFSVRRFWIELELADGRRCSSEITAAVFSQPADWLYAGGIRLPFDQPITLGIWFPTTAAPDRP